MPTLATGDLMRRSAQIDYNTYRLTIHGRAGVTLPQIIINEELTSEFGGGVVDRTLTLDLFNNLNTLDQGLTVLSCELHHIDDQVNGLAVKTTRILEDGAWPVLTGTHIDEQNNIQVDISKQVVDAGTTGGVDLDGTVHEVKVYDKWKSIMFSSQLHGGIADPGNLIDSKQWFSGKQHSFPPELSDAVIDWATASCSCSSSFSAILVANIQQYSGEVKTRITEQYYNGPPPDDVDIIQFFPQSHHFGFAWYSVCGSDDGSCRTKTGAPEFHVPLCLHDDLSLSVGAITWTFPATIPSALPHGDYIMLRPVVRRMRLGLYQRILTEVLVP